jgi:hypothetical protein
MAEQLSLRGATSGLVFRTRRSELYGTSYHSGRGYAVTPCDHPDKGLYWVAWRRYPVDIGRADSPEAAMELCRQHRRANG